MGNASSRYFLSLRSCHTTNGAGIVPGVRHSPLGSKEMIRFGVEPDTRDELLEFAGNIWRIGQRHLFVLGPFGTWFYGITAWLDPGKEVASLT